MVYEPVKSRFKSVETIISSFVPSSQIMRPNEDSALSLTRPATHWQRARSLTRQVFTLFKLKTAKLVHHLMLSSSCELDRHISCYHHLLTRSFWLPNEDSGDSLLNETFDESFRTTLCSPKEDFGRMNKR